MRKNNIDKLKGFYERFISLKGEPKTIAMGMAMGVFIGVTPTIPFHTALIIVSCLIFRQNIASAILGSWIISNPLTIPLFYVSEYKLGRYLLRSDHFQVVFTDYSIWNVVSMGWRVAVPLLTGGIIVALFFALPAYFITYRLVLTVRKNRNQ
ncbi:MAG: DUF2062 domain-containing protein [Syntrophales bacterium]|nr:DUF2062 domain-containing protein [Syntrophales bacterium]